MARKRSPAGTFRLFQSRTVVVVEICLILLLAVAVGQEISRRKSIQQEVSRLDQQIAEMQQRNVQLAQVLKDMTTDNYAEKEARKKLDMQRQGEKVVIVPKSEGSNEFLIKRPSDAAMDEIVIESPAHRWLTYLFGK